MIPPFLASLFLVGLGSAATPAPLSRSEPDWVAAERGVLENHVQLTSHERFRKAGECYFSPDGRQIVFQAIERLADESLEERYYQMYVADLVLDGAGRVSGTDNLRRLSPSGSSNTCGWFHPTEPGTVIFGSTLVPPSNADRAGYQRESSRYAWQFPREMDIVRCELARADGTARTLERLIGNSDAYLAECVISADGRYLVYCEHRVASWPRAARSTSRSAPATTAARSSRRTDGGSATARTAAGTTCCRCTWPSSSSTTRTVSSASRASSS